MLFVSFACHVRNLATRIGATGKGFVKQLFLLLLQVERKSASSICCAHSWKQNFPWLNLWRCGPSHRWGQADFSPFPSCKQELHLLVALTKVLEKSGYGWVDVGYDRHAEGLRILEVISVLRYA